MSANTTLSGHPETQQDLAPATQTVTWSSLQNLPRLTGETILPFGRRFYIYSPTMILKLGADAGEAAMTVLAHSVLGDVVPIVSDVVNITEEPPEQGLILRRQPGTVLSELWPTLDPTDQTKVRESLTGLLLRMRRPLEEPHYYGRPSERPYITLSEFGPNDSHAFCRTSEEWNESRVRSLHAMSAETDIDEARINELERLQQSKFTGELTTSPVLTHGDLSDRNILVDPITLQVTGLIDWELANVAPAYFEYVAARLSGGHDPPWRQVLLGVLREVLRIECQRKVSLDNPSGLAVAEAEDLFETTWTAWKSLVDVERPAQGYSDDCAWTFEEEA